MEVGFDSVSLPPKKHGRTLICSKVECFMSATVSMVPDKQRQFTSLSIERNVTCVHYKMKVKMFLIVHSLKVAKQAFM